MNADGSMGVTTGERGAEIGDVPGTWKLGQVLLLVLIAGLCAHVFATVWNFVVAYRLPYQLDYGEGIVWQQAALVLGPQAYSPGRTLPFIVFHYPPVFLVLSRLAALVTPDLLSGGRLVSIVSTLSIAPLIFGLVMIASPRTHRRFVLTRPEVGGAAVAGLLMLTLDAVQEWGPLMRVDMIALVLSFAGLLVGGVARGRFWGTLAALLLCMLGVFGKQTQLPAGIAVAVFALSRNPRGAIGAIVVTAAVGAALVVLLQSLTHGGFLLNILGSNLNRMSIRIGLYILWVERFTLPVMALMGFAFLYVARSCKPPGGTWRDLRRTLPLLDPAPAARTMLVVHFLLCSVMLVTIMKSGAALNYLLEWSLSGCVMIGLALADCGRLEARRGRAFPALCGLLIAFVLSQPLKLSTLAEFAKVAAVEDDLIGRIAAADRPVASEQMAILMRAGKPVVFEPSIVTELASVGLWDEAPLVRMIASGGFAFMITTDDRVIAPDRRLSNFDRRTPGVDSAMRAAYPKVEKAGPFWVHMPPD